MEGAGLTASTLSAPELSLKFGEETVMYARVVKDANIKAE